MFIRVRSRAFGLAFIFVNLRLSFLVFQPFPMRPDEIERRKVVEAGGSVVANVRKTKGVRADEELINWAEETGRFVYIGDVVRHTLYRRSPWFNPAKHRKTDHDRAVQQYRGYILKQPGLLERLPELRGKVLGCWCYPRPCHGNILIELCYKQRRHPRMHAND
jgi:Domain of unknown function (DUF4326)